MGFELEELRSVLYSAHIERSSSYPSHIIIPSSVPLPTLLYRKDEWRIESTVESLNTFTSAYKEDDLIWVSACAGTVYNPDFDFETIWKILYEAMIYTDYEFPVRGPRRYEFVPGYIYTNHWEGNLGLYNGYEQITRRKYGEVYSGLYRGGFADYLK